MHLGIVGYGLERFTKFVQSQASVSIFYAPYCSSPVIYRAVVTPNYVTIDSKCHGTSLSSVIPLWPRPLQKGNMLCLGSYLLSWDLDQNRKRREASLQRSRVPTHFSGSHVSLSSFDEWLLAGNNSFWCTEPAGYTLWYKIMSGKSHTNLVF